MGRTLITCLLMLAVQSGAWARIVDTPAVYDAEPSVSLYAAQGISLAQATRIAQQQYPGRVVRAETVERSGRRIHEVRILGADGRVRTVRIDAASGRSL